MRGSNETAERILRDHVAAAGLRIGDRLPSQRELDRSLPIGRSSLREVIERWQVLGIVEVRHGSGMVLRRPVTPDVLHVPLVLQARRDDLLRTVEVRRGLEAEAAALAAERAERDAIDTVAERLEAMEAVFHERGTAGPEDLAFHLAILDASGNPLFSQLVGQIREAMERLFIEGTSDPSFAGRSFPMHRALFEAIVRHDAAEARRQTHLILDIVREDLLALARAGNDEDEAA